MFNFYKKVKEMKNKDFSKISPEFLAKIISTIGIVVLIIFLFICFEIYIPVKPGDKESIIYTVEKGWSESQIAKDLQEKGIIRSSYFFNFYVLTSLQHAQLKAGEYKISASMSTYKIAKKMAIGDVLKANIVIFEGWTEDDIAEYLEGRELCSKEEFLNLTKKDYSRDFEFLADKPEDLDLEGYLFPDTYEIAKDETCQGIFYDMLINFGKKLTPEIREEIKSQNKTIFDIVTMASMLEKEVRTLEDKKIVSGLLWKRIEIGMPLQIDATINYITGKNDPSASIKDTRIDSPYNTYKYYGLPKGPISNPGMDSIDAAIHPEFTKYLYYLSGINSQTIFSKTFKEHSAAKAKHLGS